MTARMIMKLDVTERIEETPDVVVLSLRHPRRPQLPAWAGGAHIDLHLPDGKIRQYSLCGDPRDRSRYRIAIKRERDGRGGSSWVHEAVAVGDVVNCSAPRNNFALVEGASRHVFMAGGIGVTPLAALARDALHRGEDFELHFFARSRAHAPLLSELERELGARLHTHFDDEGAIGIDALLGTAGGAPDVHLYFCGPAGLNAAIVAAAERAGWPLERRHTEVFQPTFDENFKPEPFDITLASSGRTLRVPADRSALDVLRGEGLVMPSSCELGVCGACICGYRNGTVIHRDIVLSLADRQEKMTPCVSRARVGVTLDL